MTERPKPISEPKPEAPAPSLTRKGITEVPYTQGGYVIGAARPPSRPPR